MSRHLKLGSFLCAIALLLSLAGDCHAQRAYGVNAAGELFHFNVNTPASVSTVGNIGFVPEGIDFRPGTHVLYAIDIGQVTSQLYTINIATGATTPVGGGFPSIVAGSYDLAVNSSFGFDFNPKTLQPDNSMRIRLVSTAGVNLRLHSALGNVAAVDTPLQFAGSTNAPFVDGVAYINNIPQMAADGTTMLFDMDARNDSLYRQDPPNAGTLNLEGPWGALIDGNAPVHFDIFTALGNADPSIAGDTGYAVYRRPDAPLGGPLNSYLLYKVDLDTGATTMGALVGPAATPFNFDGGLAVLPIPEPTSLLLLAVGAGVAGGCLGRRRVSTTVR